MNISKINILLGLAVVAFVLSLVTALNSLNLNPLQTFAQGNRYPVGGPLDCSENFSGSVPNTSGNCTPTQARKYQCWVTAKGVDGKVYNYFYYSPNPCPSSGGTGSGSGNSSFTRGTNWLCSLGYLCPIEGNRTKPKKTN